MAIRGGPSEGLYHACRQRTGEMLDRAHLCPLRARPRTSSETSDKLPPRSLETCVRKGLRDIRYPNYRGPLIGTAAPPEGPLLPTLAPREKRAWSNLRTPPW